MMILRYYTYLVPDDKFIPYFCYDSSLWNFVLLFDEDTSSTSHDRTQHKSNAYDHVYYTVNVYDVTY